MNCPGIGLNARLEATFASVFVATIFVVPYFLSFLVIVDPRGKDCVIPMEDIVDPRDPRGKDCVIQMEDIVDPRDPRGKDCVIQMEDIVDPSGKDCIIPMEDIADPRGKDYITCRDEETGATRSKVNTNKK